MWRILILVFTCFLLLCGCTDKQLHQDSPISCDSLLVTPLHEYLDHPFSSEDVIRITESYYGIQPEDIKVATAGEGDDVQENIEWDKQGIHYIVVIRKGDLRVINVSDEEEKITAEILIDCLERQPEWYRATYGPRMERRGKNYYFELWFPSVGVISQTRGSASRPDRLPIPTSEFVIENIDIVSPGSLDEVYEKTYKAYKPFTSDPLDEGTKWENAQQPRLWPGNWEDVRFIEG